MKNSQITITQSPEGEFIDIFIPVSFTRKSGRKRVLTPDGKAINKDRNPEQDEALYNALVKAHRWTRKIHSGEVNSVRELAKKEGLAGGSFISKILRLVTLAPDIQEAILQAQHPTTLMLTDLMKNIPLLWDEQRRLFGFQPQDTPSI